MRNEDDIHTLSLIDLGGPSMEVTGSAETIVPPLSRCPICLDLYDDPVILSTGQTYDRSCIQKWLSQGNLTCPVTMQTLHDFSMVPNLALRHLIHSSLRSPPPPDLAAVKRVLQSGPAPIEDRIRALEMVHSLSMELPLRNHSLIAMGFFEPVLDLVLTQHFQMGPPAAEMAAVCAMKLLPYSDLRPLRNILQNKAKYEGFLSLFQHGRVAINTALCLIVEAIASSLEIQDLVQKLTASAALVREVVGCIAGENPAAGVRAVSALAASRQPDCVESLVKGGAVEGLIDYVSSENEENGRRLTVAAVAAIDSLISAAESAREAVLSHPKGVKTIVRMVFRVSDGGESESAVNSVAALCSWSAAAREKAVAEGVVRQLLVLLQSQCSGRTKGKARMVLKMIRLGQDGMNT
ncbi:U-box domain-containing protein 26-like [Andrographis paniculata]|uniref:U-box domain-containing protein 26-like n=1 Tax=Andrographis paniculata TaxID=175694 RepID=UPI0021E92FB0|nr:U-box domain-containing protein 26-like [Andrographis paniculata]